MGIYSQPQLALRVIRYFNFFLMLWYAMLFGALNCHPDWLCDLYEMLSKAFSKSKWHQCLFHDDKPFTLFIDRPAPDGKWMVD